MKEIVFKEFARRGINAGRPEKWYSNLTSVGNIGSAAIFVKVAEAFTAPLEADGWRIRWIDVQPRVAFPFPWSSWQFFGVFPRAVDPDAFVQLAEPLGGFGAEQDEQEVVLLAYQVWYLSPSLPIRSLVAGHPEAF
jgi:hypothetical protein